MGSELSDSSPILAIGAHLTRALGAGLSGSIIGTAISVPLFLPTPMMVERGIPVTMTAGFILLGISLLFTLPSALLLAAPMVWPARDWIHARPWQVGLAYAAIGALFGAAASLMLDGGQQDPFGLIGSTYGAATGAAFILLHYWTASSPAAAPEYERIFE